MFILKKTHETILTEAKAIADYRAGVARQLTDQLREATTKAAELQRALDRQAQTLHGYISKELSDHVIYVAKQHKAATDACADAKQALVNALNAKRSPSYAEEVLAAGTAHNNAINHKERVHQDLVAARKARDHHNNNYVV